MHRRGTYLPLILIIFFGFLLRLYRLAAYDLWYDESLSYSLAKLFPVFSTFATLEPHPPLYYGTLSLWMGFFGEGEFALRFLSVVCGITAIFLAYKLCGLCGDNRIALGGAIILAISPIHIWFSQEVRAYAFLTALLLAKVFFFLRAVTDSRKSSWVCFLLFSLFATYTNYFTWMMVFPEMAILLFRKHRYTVKKWTFCYVIAIAAFLPVMPKLLKDITGVHSSFWISEPTFESLLDTFINFTLGYNASLWVRAATYTCVILAVLGIFTSKKYKMFPLYFFLFFFLPILILFVFSKLVAPIYLDRYFISIAPFYLFLVVFGFMNIPNMIIRGFVGSFVVLSVFFPLSNYFSGYLPPKAINSGIYAKRPFKPAVRYIQKAFQEGDRIVHTNPCTQWSFYYYMDKDKKVITRREDIAKMRNFDLVIMPDYLDRFWYRLLVRDMSPPWVINLYEQIETWRPKRLWLVSSSWDRAKLEPNALAVREFISKRYQLLSFKKIDGIYIDLFTKGDS